MPFRCDAAGETKADRDPNPLFHLFLDPDRCPRDQLVGLFVQQQESARIDSKDLAGAEKQHREEQRRAPDARAPHP